MHFSQRIAPCLWFDDQAEPAAEFYVSVFDRSRIRQVTRYPAVHVAGVMRAPGTVMTVAFELDGQPFTALNGGPGIAFNEAVSLQVVCETQAEIDYYWDKLSRNGDERSQRCGWLRDQFGVSWQVVPSLLPDLLLEHDAIGARHVMESLLAMKKIDVEELQRAMRITAP